MKSIIPILVSAFALITLAGCENLQESALTGGEDVPYDKLAINMFPRNRVVGDLASQIADIKALGIKHIRVTFWFDNQFLAYSGAAPNFAMFDGLVNDAVSAGVEIIPILAYVPNWLKGNSGWKTVFINQYVIPIVARYGPYVNYWEVWNEPDELTFNVLDGTAADYFDLLQKASAAIRAYDPSAKIVSAATANIVADGLAKFNWTQSLIDMGLSSYADIVNLHYYSDLDIELSAFGGGLVESSGMTVWVTETGKFGQSGQKGYFDSNMPYINKSVNPELIFWYCYVEGHLTSSGLDPENTYGLLTFSGGHVVESPLYTHLKNR